ncbi:MAG: hypothetical protein KAI57_05170 [Candidatus Pacebacteria bacterium]|nr:hypothetical protein [Candidatus Paceibacterota bacterium]
MIVNFLKQSFFLNLILSILTLVLIIERRIGIEDAMFFIVSAGFVASFFTNENSLVCYLKLIFFNSLIFGFLLSLFFLIFVFFSDSQFREAYAIYHFLFLIFPISFYGLLIGLCSFFGGLTGIIPKFIIERFKDCKSYYVR